MMMPRSEMEKELKTQEKELSDDINGLNKKVRHSQLIPQRAFTPLIQTKYLEKQFNDAQAQIRDIVSAPRKSLFIFNSFALSSITHRRSSKFQYKLLSRA